MVNGPPTSYCQPQTGTDLELQLVALSAYAGNAATPAVLAHSHFVLNPASL